MTTTDRDTDTDPAFAVGPADPTYRVAPAAPPESIEPDESVLTISIGFAGTYLSGTLSFGSLVSPEQIQSAVHVKLESVKNEVAWLIAPLIAQARERANNKANPK